jgi:hypothetical protein
MTEYKKGMHFNFDNEKWNSNEYIKQNMIVALGTSRNVSLIAVPLVEEDSSLRGCNQFLEPHTSDFLLC